MAEIPDYERGIRGSDGIVYIEALTSLTDDINGVQRNAYTLESTTLGTMGHVIGVYRWIHVTATNEVEEKEDRMPSWWSKPSNPEAIAKKYAEGGRKVIPVNPNAVTVAPYMENGRLQLQKRGYVSPKGLPVVEPGLLSLNGGNMKSDDVEANLRREARGELGIEIGSHFIKIGDLYDPDAGRTNHIFRLTMPYDQMLYHQHLKSKDAVAALVNPEGLGRDFVWREDLEAIIAAKMLTGISMRILAAFPDLLPPPRPKA